MITIKTSDGVEQEVPSDDRGFSSIRAVIKAYFSQEKPKPGSFLKIIASDGATLEVPCNHFGLVAAKIFLGSLFPAQEIVINK